MRGIECGALVDPWNILGFDSNFSLFPALENSIPDHRIDLLIGVMDRMFSLFARSLCCAAAGKHSKEAKDISSEFKQLSLWWDQFAADSVGDCESVEGRAIYEDSQIAAQALAAWQKLGATSGDVRFWRPFVEQIDSAKGYVLIIDTLLDHRDFVAAMHLMMHWLSQSDQVNLHKGSDLFHLIANRWLNDALNMLEHVENAQVNATWNMVAKFFDFLEANSGIYGQVPKWELINSTTDHGEQPFKLEDDPADELYSAAYDEVVYRDSTDDGVEGEILGTGADSFGLAEEARRLSERLGFMVTITRLWKHVAVTSVANADDSRESMQSRFASWLSQARDRQKELRKLIKAIERCDLPQPLPTSASLIEYDRNRAIHEVLIERAIDTYLADLETIQSLFAATTQQPSCPDALTESVACLIRAALKSDVAAARKQVSSYIQDLPQQNFLYIPMAKGGNALTIAQTKGHQRNLKLILDVLPRMGLLHESMMLLHCCAEAERSQAGSSGCVTEFDQMFYVANQQMIAAVVASVSNTKNLKNAEKIAEGEHRDKLLIDYLQQLVGHTSQLWIEHSQTLRLSVLEKVYAEKKWNALVNFIQAHGEDIFTQTFLHLGNLRAILHRGVSLWLEENAASSEEKEWSIYSVMKTDEDKQQIVGHLQVIIEAIVENYGEYREYNGTTTQSDSGELLYAFLDMLRLRSSYDRVAWNLMPAMQVHEILLRYECEAAAEYWRSEMMQRTRETADEMIKKLRELEKRYGMKISTIANRLEEKFVRPLEVDRTKVLIEKCASNDTRQNEEWFSTLEEQIDELSQEPTGAGLDLPQWIATLEEQVRDTSQNHLRRIREDITQKVPQRILGREELEEQLQGFV